MKISQVLKEEFGIELKYNEKRNMKAQISRLQILSMSSKADEINKQSNLFGGMIGLTKEFEKAQTIKNIVAQAQIRAYEDKVRMSYELDPSLAQLLV